MPLSEKQLNEIEEIIKKRYLSFMYEALGDSVLTDAELNLLKKKGLIKESTKKMIGDAHALGKIAALVDRRRMRRVTYDEVLRAAKRMTGQTSIEKKAIKYATENAGQYITGLRDEMVRDARAFSARHSGMALRRVREEVSEAIAERKTLSELKSELFHSFDDKYRDWQRVAHTEVNNSIQNAVYHEIKENSDDGVDQLVYKLPNPSACKWCVKLYLQKDGITPRIFKMSDLAESNVGRKAADWLPTIGAAHPWCFCQLIPVVEGFNFVKKPIALEPVKVGEKSYKKGQVVSEEDAKKIDKKKLGMNAVFTFTGETAKVTKSLPSLPISEESYCEHCGVSNG